MRLADKRALMALAFDPAPEMKVSQTATMKRGAYHYTRTNFIFGRIIVIKFSKSQPNGRFSRNYPILLINREVFPTCIT